MLRDILGGIAGIVIAVLIEFLADMLSHTVYPPPAEFDSSDMEAMRLLIAEAPLGALLIVMFGPIIGTFIGAVVGGRVGTAKTWVYPAVVGSLMFAATVSNLIAIPHPMWFAIASLVGILLSGWLAFKVAQASRKLVP